MAGSLFKFSFWVFSVVAQILGCTFCCSSWCPQNPNSGAEFNQKTDRFWEFDEQSNSWVEMNLPFDLLSCVNGNCTKVGTIQNTRKSNDLLEGLPAVTEQESDFKFRGQEKESAEESSNEVLSLRKRISLTKMTDASIWVTGESGSIYERFWNGVQWVIAPHELPTLAGPAVSIFIVNQTILALSEAGILYQLQLHENSHPIWTEFMPSFEWSMQPADTEPSSTMYIKSGLLSNDKEELYFTTKNGLLLELNELQPLRWTNHGRPPGGDVAGIADVATFRPDVVFIVSAVLKESSMNLTRSQSHHGKNTSGVKHQLKKFL